jgi:hypothetical protein
MRIKGRHRRPGGGFFKFRDVGRLSAETVAKAEDLEASMDHGAPTLQSGSQRSYKVCFAYD